ncbi:MAG: DUF3035 domain-containing protein, partial [Pseudomonadota bacterium]
RGKARVLDRRGAVVRSWILEAQAAGEWAWDGKDSAGATVADPNIRVILAAENGGRSDKDRSFANQLMFWKFVDGKVDDKAAPLKVDDPAAWHAERKEAIDAVIGEGGKVVIKNDDALALPGVY